MICDQLSNLKSYRAIAPEAFDKMIEFISGLTADAPTGKTELIGSDLYASVQRYQSHEIRPEKIETHTEYIDLQMLLAGTETIYAGPVEAQAVSTPYNPEKDIAFFRGDAAKLLPVTLKAGNFAIFLPEEGHMPGCGDGSAVVKVVIKIRRKLFQL